MPRPNRFYDVIRIGPVRVGTFNNGRGQIKHTAACTAPDCGFSTEHGNRSAAELAARTHRCTV
ncbi:mobile element transfer protein [Streptomyces sp. NPDC093544]|uniref:mobile element transfer protein n=1 Tax=Streptomyces sp. NPDC093544 TaxID=3155200 RepID=UPI003433D8FA